jgi:hypothetical protein
MHSKRGLRGYRGLVSLRSVIWCLKGFIDFAAISDFTLVPMTGITARHPRDRAIVLISSKRRKLGEPAVKPEKEVVLEADDLESISDGNEHMNATKDEGTLATEEFDAH